MTLNETAGLVVSVVSIIAALAGGVRWLVKHYLAELRPNGGESLKDKVNKLEEQHKSLSDKIDQMYSVLLEHVARNRD